MAWFLSTDLSLTNGSRTVTVGDSVDTSIVRAGDALMLPNHDLVEIGSVFSNTLELRQPWPYPDLANSNGVVVPTSGDFKSATVAMQNATTLTAENMQAVNDWSTKEGTVTFTDPRTLETFEVKTVRELERQGEIEVGSAAEDADRAEAAAAAAATSAQDALDSANGVEQFVIDAEAAKDRAVVAETNAGNYATAAASAAEAAGISETNSANSATASETSKVAAEAAKTAAETAETNAQGHESTSSTKATEAASSASLAQQWANADEDVEVQPGEYSAKHFSIKMDGEVVKAETARTGAETAQTAAEAAQANAEQEAIDANTAKTMAETAESNASASASAAANSESVVESHKTAAGVSETNAANSATLADKLANQAEDLPITELGPDVYSAFHWMMKANEIATGAHHHDDLYYGKAYVDATFATLTGLNGKSDLNHTHTEADITDLDKYTQSETDAAITAAINGSEESRDPKIAKALLYAKAGMVM